MEVRQEKGAVYPALINNWGIIMNKEVVYFAEVAKVWVDLRHNGDK